MGWVPNEMETLQLTNELKQKLGLIPDTKPMKDAIAALCGAKGKKQALAVIGAVGAVKDITTLAEYGFDRIADNDPKTIKAALVLAPPVVARQREEARIAAIDNDRINGYLGSLPTTYKRHMSGETLALPITDGGQTVARTYGNAEGNLPLGRYVEWYARIGSTRSTEKRFFTRQSDTRLWYTEGGTHGTTTKWWCRVDETDAWIKR